ncbi:hypothetical protein P692DRAFT_201873591 [Suillus brevipes Sb2]|nr:hypothetical protein P692DRAFT_201873591 [Suillus brevipes Sb2]
MPSLRIAVRRGRKKTLWDDALQDARTVIKLTPSSHIGYQSEHAALHGAQRYDEAIDAFQTTLFKFENAPGLANAKPHSSTSSRTRTFPRGCPKTPPPELLNECTSPSASTHTRAPSPLSLLSLKQLQRSIQSHKAWHLQDQCRESEKATEAGELEGSNHPTDTHVIIVKLK